MGILKSKNKKVKSKSFTTTEGTESTERGELSQAGSLRYENLPPRHFVPPLQRRGICETIMSDELLIMNGGVCFADGEFFLTSKLLVLRRING